MKSKNNSAGNILLVANWQSDVGYAWWLIENFWVSIAGHFGGQGRACVLVYPEITRIPDAVAAADIRIEELDFRDASAGGRRRLKKLIRENNITCVYLSDAPAYSLLYLRLRLWGVRRIVVHDHAPGSRTRPGRLRALAKRLIHGLPWVTADHYIAVTEFVRRRFVEVGCIPQRKCSVAPNGIVPFDIVGADREYARRTFAIPPGRLIVVTTGRVTWYKGIDFIIKCLAELVNVRGRTDFHFLCCGDGPDIGVFFKHAEQYEVDRHISFTGKRSDVRSILPACDIGFHASLGEVGYSLSILEYMSAGLATLVPDLPSTRESVSDEVDGLVYRSEDVKAACDRLERLSSPDYRQRLSRVAMQKVAEHYNVEQTNQALVQILNRQF